MSSACEVSEANSEKSVRGSGQDWHPLTDSQNLYRTTCDERSCWFHEVGTIVPLPPPFTESECQIIASRSLLDRIFGGPLQPMLSRRGERDS